MVPNDAKSSFYEVLQTYNQNKSEANFANVILQAWMLVETYVNRLYLKELGVPPDTAEKNYDNLIDVLEGISFEQKRQFLIKSKSLTKQEAEAICTFQHERNRLFHASKKNDVLSTLFMRHLQEPVVEKAKNAFDAVWEAIHRAYNINCG